MKMKVLKLIFVILLLNTIIYANNFDKLLYDKIYYKRKIEQGRLIQDYRCKIRNNVYIFVKDSILEFHNNGTIAFGYLKKNQMIIVKNNKINLLAVGNYDGDVQFDDKGNILKGYLNKKSLLKVGKVKYVFSKTRKIIQQSHQKKYYDYIWPVRFHKNGNIKSGELGENTRIYNNTVKKGTIVHFDKFGNLNHILFTKKHIYNLKEYEADSSIFLDNQGKVTSSN